MANDDARGGTPWFNRLAHDLRSPLSSLQTAAYLLRTDPGGSNSRELADIVVRQSQRMARMVDELDDWSRAQQGRLVSQDDRVELGAALDMAVGSLHSSNIDPHYGAGTQEAIVLGDSARLSQLFRALLEQAIARDAKSARVDVSLVGDKAEIVFSDHGPVVDDAARAALLAGPQIPPLDEGLGLRLLIAKAIVDAHGGSLSIDGGSDGATQRIRCVLPVV